jgi:hypothetical protein
MSPMHRRSEDGKKKNMFSFISCRFSVMRFITKYDLWAHVRSVLAYKPLLL